MRVVLVSKALVVGAYQRKAEELASLGVDLTVLVPPRWADRRGLQEAQTLHTAGYVLRTVPVRFGGNYHLHYYPTLARELAALNPQILHMDEEPYNLATWAALGAATRHKVRATFFTWQNILRHYPPPFNWMERANYRRTPVAIAGNTEAGAVLRAKGYQGEVAVIPQFGVDPMDYRPLAQRSPGLMTIHGRTRGEEGFRIGYAGGLIPEKGIDLLLEACAGLSDPWRLLVAGEGPEKQSLMRLAWRLKLGDRVAFVGRLPASEMAAFLGGVDVLVLPSRTQHNWKEQFGRVLIEAMACEVAVIGSSCGEIPNVIGDAGLIFAENDVDALKRCLRLFQASPDKRRAYALRGRARVLSYYTMRHIAAQTIQVYAQLLRTDPGGHN